MKKILLATAACAMLAASPTFAAEGDFYVKANVGWSKLNKIGPLKSKNDAFAGLAVGYSVMDNVRVDLSYDHFFDPQFKGTIKADQKSVKNKLDIDSLLLNAYVDLFDVSITKVFVGAGVGTSRLAAKINKTNLITNTSDTTKIKAQNKFAYALYVGASAEVAPSVFAEITYSFRDFDKIKGTDKRIQGHHVAAGVRFEI